MKIIPKFLSPWSTLQEWKEPEWKTQPLWRRNPFESTLQTTGTPEWFKNLFQNSQSVIGLGTDASNNPKFTGRYTGNNLDQAYKRNSAYANSGQQNKEKDILNWFDTHRLTPKVGSTLDELTESYNKDVLSLWNQLNSSWDYSTKNAGTYNQIHKGLYNSANQGNGDENGYNIGWDENQVTIPGSATQSRRPVVYEHTFEDDLALDIESARNRVSKINFNGVDGYVYTDERGFIHPLTDDLQYKLGLKTRPAIKNKVQQDPDRTGDSDGPGDVGAKTTKLKSLNNGTNKFSWLKPAFLGGLRVAVDNYLTSKAIEEYNPQPPLLDPKQFHKAVYGDYIAKRLGEQLSARYLSMASRPMTSDGSLQLAGQLEAVDRGNQAMLQGQMRDAQQYYATRDAALDQAKENLYNRVDISNLNRQTLAQYNREKEQLKYQGKISNALNWDRFASIWEDRALAKYDYEELKKRNMQELMDALSDLLGVDDSAYKVKFDQYKDAVLRGDSAAASKLEALLIDLKKKMLLQVYRNMGDRVGITWNKYWNDIFKRDGISSIKNGGTLRKFLAGGGFPTVQWTPLMGQPYHTYLSLLMSGQSGASSASSKSSSSSNVEKEQSSLLKSMIETLKSGELLPSDMEVISALLSNFFDILKYALGNTDLDTIYRGYIGVLNQVNRAKYSANSVKEAKTHLDSNKALNSYAVTQDGEVWVGKVNTQEMGKISVNDAVKVLNGELPGYRILTNADLLEVRAKLPSLAFSDGMIMESATSGTSMEAIAQYVQKFIGQLGTDKQSRDLFTRDFGNNAEQGITVLNNLKSRGFTENEANALALALSGTGGINSLLEANIATESLLNQARSALTALLRSLPPNMQALLYLQGRGEAGGSEILTNLVLKGTSSNFKVGINDITPFNPDGTLGSSSKTGKGSSGSSGGSDDALDRTLTDILRGIGGTSDRLIINPGTKSQFEVDVTNYLVPGAYTTGNLEDILNESKLTGIAIKTNIYFGDLKLPTERLGDIAYLGRGFSRAILPIKKDGSPDLSIINRYETACDNTRNKGFDPIKIMNGQETRAEALKVFSSELQKVELYDLINRETGLPNLSKVGVFLVTEGLGSSKAGLLPSTYVKLKEDADYDLMTLLLSRKGPDGKIQEYELDRPDWGGLFPGDLFGMYDSIYEGTIYIPISINELQGSTAAGNKLKTSTAETMEQGYQRFEKLRQYNPGSGTPDNILSQ